MPRKRSATAFGSSGPDQGRSASSSIRRRPTMHRSSESIGTIAAALAKAQMAQAAGASSSSHKGGNGAPKVSRQPQAVNTKSSPAPALELTPDESASLLKQFLDGVQGLKSPDAAFAWACQAIGAKNSLTGADARVLDDAFRAKLADLEVLSPEDITASSRMTGTQHAASGSLMAEGSNSTRIDKGALSFPEQRRIRDRH